MLAKDTNKTLHWSPNTFLSPNQSAPFASLRGLGDYNSEGKLQQGLRGLRGYQVFAYDPSTLPGLGSYQVFAYDPVTFPGLGYLPGKRQSALGNGDCGCGCNGIGGCLGGDAFTTQMSGLGLNPPDYGQTSIADTMALVGSMDPEPISATALQVGAAAANAIQSIENFFHIGSGRREANEIVPIQNSINTQVLAPAYSEMGQGQALNCSSIAAMYLAVFRSWQQWLHFLHDTYWSDGRAARQAEDTLAPYFNTILGSDSGAPGQYEKGGFEQIFDAKNCGSWISTTPPGTTGTGATPPVINPSGPGVAPFIGIGVLSSGFVRQLLPYALVGTAVYFVAKAVRR